MKDIDLSVIDKETFKKIEYSNSTDEEIYYKDKNNIYIKQANGKFAILNIVNDKSSFNVIENKDSFKAINRNFVIFDNEVSYKPDNEMMFYLLYGVDPNTFEVLYKDFSRDKNLICYKSGKIPFVDVETFEWINDNYFKDKNGTYYISGLNSYRVKKEDLENFDPDSMKIKKEHLVHQQKSTNFEFPEGKIQIKGKEDPLIRIFEPDFIIDMYKYMEGIGFLKEHIVSNDPTPLTTGFLFGSGTTKVKIDDIKIANFGNNYISLLFYGNNDNGGFVLDKQLFPFHFKEDFDYLLSLYNQEKTNLYTYKGGEIFNQSKIFNKLYLDDNLGNILSSIDTRRFIEDNEELAESVLEIDTYSDYSLEYIYEKLGKNKYIYID